jgi:deferrochelatase/peroxidase EfeB
MTHPSTEQQPPKEPQPVLGPLTSAAIFLVVTIEPGGESVVREVLTDLAGLQRSVGSGVPAGELRCAIGISYAWDRLFGGERPAELHPFREVAGDKHRAVSTPGDVLFHLRAWQMDLCFELASQIDGAFVLSTRGDYELHLGQDLSIGYSSHDATSIELYFQESLTFLMYTSEAAVALSAKGF